MRLLYPLAQALGMLAELCTEALSTRLFRFWSHLWIRASGVRVEVDGELVPRRPVLLVANHVTYFDVIVLLRAHPFLMASADEMRHDRYVGRLLRNMGTIFVDRARLSALRGFVSQVSGVLRGGQSVAVFPEGRIRCSAPGGEFAPAVMQAAVDSGVPVRPVLIWCELPDGSTTSRASWLGAESLRDSLRRLQRMKGLTVRIQVLPDIDPASADNRSELAHRARAALAEASRGFPDHCVSGGTVESAHTAGLNR